MSRSFRTTYLGKPSQALRGWHQGKRRAIAKKVRYNLKNFIDEEKASDLPGNGYRKLKQYLGRHYWNEPEDGVRIIYRNGRKYLVKIREACLK